MRLQRGNISKKHRGIMKEQENKDKIMDVSHYTMEKPDEVLNLMRQQIFLDIDGEEISEHCLGITIRDVDLEAIYLSAIGMKSRLTKVMLSFRKANNHGDHRRYVTVKHVPDGDGDIRPMLNLSEIRRKFDEIQLLLPEIFKERERLKEKEQERHKKADELAQSFFDLIKNKTSVPVSAEHSLEWLAQLYKQDDFLLEGSVFGRITNEGKGRFLIRIWTPSQKYYKIYDLELDKNQVNDYLADAEIIKGNNMKTPREIYLEVTRNGTEIMKYYMFEKALRIYDQELKKQIKKVSQKEKRKRM